MPMSSSAEVIFPAVGWLMPAAFAIATHGRTGPGRVVLGSVADYVIHNSSLPLLLIRRELDLAGEAGREPQRATRAGLGLSHHHRF